MALLYYYTNKAGKDAIYAAEYIKPTNCGDGLGKVIRLTNLEPTTSKSKLLENNFGKKSSKLSSKDAEKTRFWFTFELDELPKDTVRVADVEPRNLWTCPTKIQVKKRATLYHYTDKNGKDEIYKRGHIKASRPRNGQGDKCVYFTELPPTSSKPDLLWHFFGTKENARKDLIDKTKFWFKFESVDLPGVSQRQTRDKRNEWVFRGDVEIKTPSGQRSRSSRKQRSSSSASQGSASDGSSQQSGAGRRRRSTSTDQRTDGGRSGRSNSVANQQPSDGKNKRSSSAGKKNKK